MTSLIAALAASLAGAEAPQAERPPLLSELVDCRKIAADAERLACYDRRVLALDKAERKRDVVVVDRQQVRRARRSLFGLTLPSFKLFDGTEGAAEPEFTELETSIKSVTQSGGRWQFTLEDDARWVQTDSEDLGRSPKPGQKIRIRKGAMGSFLANVDRLPAIRVKRVN